MGSRRTSVGFSVIRTGDDPAHILRHSAPGVEIDNRLAGRGDSPDDAHSRRGQDAGSEPETRRPAVTALVVIQLCRPLHLREATEPREEPDQRVLEAEFFCDLVPVRLGARGAEVQHQRHHVVLGLAQPGNAGKEEDVRESQRDFQPADDGPAKQKGISLGDDRG